MRTANTLRHIEYMAALPLGAHIVIPEILRALDDVIPGAASSFFWIGQCGTIVDAYAPSDKTSPSIALGYEGLLRQDGTGKLQLNCTVNGQLRGVLAICRDTEDEAFGQRERNVVRAALPSLTRALDNRPDDGLAYDEVPDATAVVIVGEGGQVISADAQALDLVGQMSGNPITPRATGCALQLPQYLSSLLSPRRLQSPQVIEQATRWGRYRARAFAQIATDSGRDSQFALVITRHSPVAIRLIRALARLDLSPRERQVAFQLALGTDARVAAAQLDVALVTWRSYVKRVYQRLDVRGRFDLVSRLQPGLVC